MSYAWDIFCPECCAALESNMGEDKSDEEIEEEVQETCRGKIFLCNSCKGTKFLEGSQYRPWGFVLWYRVKSYYDFDNDKIVTEREAKESGKEIILGG